MSLNKLTRRLRREIRSSPKKAAALGLLLLVAVYYWVPLLKGTIANEDQAVATAAELPEPGFPSVAIARPGPQLEATAAAAAPSYGWEDLVRWSREDAATRPAETLIQRRDPFQPVRTEIAEVDSAPKEEAPVQPLVTPEKLGMKLSGTVVGKGRKVAVIDGKAYAEGRSVQLFQDGRVIDFKLTEVHPERIVLEQLGERFELEIKKGARDWGPGTGN